MKPCAGCNERPRRARNALYCDVCYILARRKSKHDDKRRAKLRRVGLAEPRKAKTDSRLTLVSAPEDVWPAQAVLPLGEWRLVARVDAAMTAAEWRDKYGQTYRYDAAAGEIVPARDI